MKEITIKTNHQKQGQTDPSTQPKTNLHSPFSYQDNRPETKVQRDLQSTIHNGTRTQAQKIQMKSLFGDKTKTLGSPSVLQKSGDLSEHLSGTQIHWNSKNPASVGAHAYAQGKSVHIAPGQEKHVYHELGHVVQQSRGHVPITKKVNGASINDNPALETQADRIGAQIKSQMTLKKGENSL